MKFNVSMKKACQVWRTVNQAIRRGIFRSTLTHRRGGEEQKLSVFFGNMTPDQEIPAHWAQIGGMEGGFHVLAFAEHLLQVKFGLVLPRRSD